MFLLFGVIFAIVGIVAVSIYPEGHPLRTIGGILIATGVIAVIVGYKGFLEYANKHFDLKPPPIDTTQEDVDSKIELHYTISNGIVKYSQKSEIPNGNTVLSKEAVEVWIPLMEKQ